MSRWTLDRVQGALDELLGDDGLTEAKRRKRDRIVKVATELFTVHGYRRTSMDEVAHRAGVAKGTVYLYFKTKADLLQHAVALEKKRYLELWRPIFAPDNPPAERLRDWITIAITMSREMPLVSKLMRGDHELAAVMDDLDSGARARVEAMRFDIVSELIEQAAAPGSFSQEELIDRAKVFIGLVLGSLHMTDESYRGGLSLDRYAELLADVVVHGLLGRRAAAVTDKEGDP